LFSPNRKRVIEGAASLDCRDLPVAGNGRGWWLDCLGPRSTLLYRQMARQIVKIFRGPSPADIPSSSRRHSSLVINLKTAKALGLTVPQSMLRVGR